MAAYLHIQKTRSNIVTHLEMCFLMNLSFTLFLAMLWLELCVSVFQLFGAAQWELFCWKQLAASIINEVDERGETEPKQLRCRIQKQHSELKDA